MNHLHTKKSGAENDLCFENGMDSLTTGLRSYAFFMQTWQLCVYYPFFKNLKSNYILFMHAFLFVWFGPSFFYIILYNTFVSSSLSLLKKNLHILG